MLEVKSGTWVWVLEVAIRVMELVVLSCLEQFFVHSRGSIG